ncbi:hypothetical protein [Nonomuraea basaltis]|uniref:hypothetical protein n=1 Tax=Nonomuraea basaltis TaxID=2495887 RepID=UPI00110C5EE2|nr:hypothetical protein [Nonomuraea basaltis]TMR91309.1 hypothetical protein EJK15_50865 [Nonomuraea basaltis]
MSPRIPKRMAGCPVHGGLAVPEVAARHSDERRPPLFGINHPGRVNTCLMEKRCGGCAQPLSTRPGGKYTLLLRPADFTRGYSSEPALHTSDCAPYATEACPLLNGRMSSYRTTRRDLEAERCGQPTCDCRLWTNSDDHGARAGATASPFYAAIYRAGDYRPHWGDVRQHRNVLLGVAVAGVEPLSIRLVTRGEPSFLDFTRALIMDLPLD